jgi:ankyrin repeat protein
MQVSPLHFAALHGNTQLATLLVSKGLSPLPPLPPPPLFERAYHIKYACF